MDQFSSHPLYRKHDLDSVMTSSLAFYKNKFVVLFITSFIMSLGVQLLSLTFDVKGLMNISSNPDDISLLVEKMKAMIWPMIKMSILYLLLNLLFTTVLHYYVIYNPINKTNIFVSTYKSLKYFIPYLIVFILLAVAALKAMFLGFLIFMIGIFFALLYISNLYFFILPILMVEGPNIRNAIGRTYILAHRRFWPNMVWVAIFIIIVMIISLILSGIVLLPFTGSFLKMFINPEEASKAVDFMTNPFYLALSALARALYMPLFSIFAVILYFNGKAREEDILSTTTGNNEPEKVRVEDLYPKPKD
jgi:hypothetical protein